MTQPVPTARAPNPAVEAEALYRYRWVILGLSIFVQTAVASASQGVPPLASFYQVDLRLSRAQVGIMTAAVSMGQIPSLLVSGWLTDIVGIRLMMAAGPAVTGLAAIGLMFSTSFEQAVVLLLMAGIGSGIGNPGVTKAVFYWFPLRMRATVMGIKQTGVPLGGAVFAAALPAVALAAGWRAAVLTLGLFDLFMGVMSFVLYREPPGSPSRGGAMPRQAGALRRVLANRNIWLTGLLAAVLVGIQFCLITYLMLYLRDVLRVPIVVAGVMLSVVQITGLSARIFWGFVSDRFLKGRRKPVMLLSAAGTAVTLLLFGLIQPGIPLVLVVALSIALGFTCLGWHGIFMVLVSELAGMRMAATAVGLGMTISAVGNLLLPPLFGVIADALDYHWAWFSLAGLSAVGFVVFLFMREPVLKE
ncbi:MAG: MFS transporter [Dehalococcoidia bacterium]|nr:MFS transporter [Dehalococcoidia bacterium]